MIRNDSCVAAFSAAQERVDPPTHDAPPLDDDDTELPASSRAARQASNGSLRETGEDLETGNA
ncbi:hypothetical protein [Burkholderia sp. BCC1977]|uniref:hypothetical protein n=1 Tax=Burkholderia sp. BCC1977 TaxID=2817440 RepID=UPI002ABE08C8|nr:hypothetical protein [Burkholderia sp. BCC1977]